MPPAQLQAKTEGQFLYGAFRIGSAGTKQERVHESGSETHEQVYRMEADNFTVQRIEPHVVRKNGGKEYESWSTSSPILSSFMAEHAAKGKNLTMVPVSVWAQRVFLYPNTPEVYVSLFYIVELDQYYYYMFEVQPPFRVLGMGPKPLPELDYQSLLLPAEGSFDGPAHLATIAAFLPSAPTWPTGLTLVVMSHKRDRLDGLLATVNRYCQSSPDLLHEVVLIWNNQTDLEAAEMIRQNTSGGGVPVRVLETDVNSMNNRFAVWGALQTVGVIIQDDDLWISLDSLQLLVDAWRVQPDQLFGAAYERVDVQSRDASDMLEDGKSWENNSYQWKEVNPKCYSQSSSDIPSDIPVSDIQADIPYCVFDTRDYSMLLPHPWVLSRKYLRNYMEHSVGTQLVDNMMNCDDIYLNSVVSNATRAPPIALNIPVHRFPEWANGDAMWVSQGKKWLEKRSRCLEEVNSIYAGQPMSEDTGTIWRRNFSGVFLSETVQGYEAQKAPHYWQGGPLEVADGPKLAEALQLWGSRAAAAQAKALTLQDMPLANASSKAVQAAASNAVQFSSSDMEGLGLTNPSLIEMPAEWRQQPGEMWLAVFRTQATEKVEKHLPTWYSSHIVLAVLDAELVPVRPLRVLGSHDFFSEPFDCQMTTTPHTYFGPEDARIFSAPEASGVGSQVLVFFTARLHEPEPNTPCAVSGGQRMYLAKLGSDLLPTSSSMILVNGEFETTKNSLGRPRIPDSSSGSYPVAGLLGAVEKNWSPFIYASDGAEQVLLEYSIDPHIVMDLDVAGYRAGGEGLWQTSSPCVKSWLQSRTAAMGQEYLNVHGGVGAILLDLPQGHKVFLSILHTSDPRDSTYRSFFFTFEAEPPFAISNISERELPLKKKTCSWYAEVAFPTNLRRMEGHQGPELWVLYGSGDYESHRLVLPWSELQAFLPESESAVDADRKAAIVTDTGNSSALLNMPNSHPTDLIPDAEIVRLLGKDIAWQKQFTAEDAMATLTGNLLTAGVHRMQTAIAHDIDNLVGTHILGSLYNPSLVEIPDAWRRPGEKWLAVFRQKEESNESVEWQNGTDASWYFFSLVTTVLDEDLKPVRPLRVLRSSDFFPGNMDCQLTSTNVSYFGPADARLFLDRNASDPSVGVLLMFTARVVGRKPGTPCPAHGGQRMYLATLDHDLHPVSAGPILVAGEEEEKQRTNVSTLAIGQDASLSQHKGTPQKVGPTLDVGELKEIEKNWAFFLYKPPLSVKFKTLVEYSVEPHVVMDLDVENRRAGSRQVWQSSSPAVPAWAARRAAASGLPVSDEFLHGGVGALLAELWPGQPKVFLSILHAAFQKNSTDEPVYHSFLYTFSPEPPFRITGIGDKALPLVMQPCRWGALVAFPVSAILTGGPGGKEFWVLYGSGDSEARRWVASWEDLQAFLPSSDFIDLPTANQTDS